MSSLPSGLRSLSAEEAEDVLCIYRRALARINQGGTARAEAFRLLPSVGPAEHSTNSCGPVLLNLGPNWVQAGESSLATAQPGNTKVGAGLCRWSADEPRLQLAHRFGVAVTLRPSSSSAGRIGQQIGAAGLLPPGLPPDSVAPSGIRRNGIALEIA
jgi:hypothetical protein